MKRDADLRATQMSDSKERQFRLEQAKERNRIRIEQGRAKAIDLLARYSRFNDEVEEGKDQDFELENPIEYIRQVGVMLELAKNQIHSDMSIDR